MKHGYVLQYLDAHKRNNTIVRPHNIARENILWFLGHTNDETTNKEIAKILNLKYSTVKKEMANIAKSKLSTQFLTIQKRNNVNVYQNTLPPNTNISILSKQIQKTTDKSIRFKPETLSEKFQKLNVDIPYKCMWKNIFEYIRRSGDRGITFNELVNSFGFTHKDLKKDKTLMIHIRKFVKNELRRWKQSNIKYLVNTRQFKGKTFYYICQGKDLSVEIVSLIANASFKPTLELNKIGKYSNSKEVFQGKTLKYCHLKEV